MNLPTTFRPLDPNVRELIQKVLDFYKGLKAFEVDLAVSTHIDTIGLANAMNGSFHVAMERPSSFSMVQTTGLPCGSLVSDGKTQVVYVPILEKYTSKNAPKTIEEVVEPINMMTVSGIFPTVSFGFLQEDPLAKLDLGILESSCLGSEEVGGVSVTHLQIVSSFHTLYYWIADGPAPVILKEMSTISGMTMPDIPENAGIEAPPIPAAIQDMMKNMTMSKTTIYSNWILNKYVAPSLFQFTPPPAAKLVNEFFEPRALSALPTSSE